MTPFETFACDDMKVRNWRSLPVEIDERKWQVSIQSGPPLQKLDSANNDIRVPSFILSGAPKFHHFRTKLGTELAAAMRRISAVQDTFVVARKKTSQVTMLEVVVGSHFGFPRTP